MQFQEGVGEPSDRLGVAGVIALQSLVRVVAAQGMVGAQPLGPAAFRIRSANQQIGVAPCQSVIRGEIGGTDGVAEVDVVRGVGSR